VNSSDSACGGYSIVLATAGTRRLAEEIARKLVEEKLAACVQIHRTKSFYRWNGAVRSGGEYLFIIKTKSQLFDAISEFIGAHHDYQTPEVIRIAVQGGDGKYLHWIDDCLSP
jgi:periplasmic divalent cation tolerance protein